VRLLLATGLWAACSRHEPPPPVAVPVAATPSPSPVVPSVLDAGAVFKRVSASVVIVEALDAKDQPLGQGSGVTLGDDIVVTNWHVVSLATKVQIKRDRKTWPATIEAANDERDLARLRAPGLGLPQVSLASEQDALKTGDRVYAVGAPLGLELSLSEGIVSGLREESGAQLVQTTAAISPGSSGGGLFNARGELVGVTAFQYRSAQSLNFALPRSWIAGILETPKGTLPARVEDPLLRLSSKERDQLQKAARAVLDDGRLPSVLERREITRMLRRLEPLSPGERQRLHDELGGGEVAYERLFWQDAFDAYFAGRATKSAGRQALERRLIAEGVLNTKSLERYDSVMHAVVSHGEVEFQHVTVVFNERALGMLISNIGELQAGLDETFRLGL
jgi:S1-C subfamily serine protease